MKRTEEYNKEARRLESLHSYSIMDTPMEAEYDNLTALAAQICGTPISLVTLLDGRRQWFKSRHGLDVPETPKEHAFCAHAINHSERVFQVEDSRKDERFRGNPLVDGRPNVIFYAGVPLKGADGLPLGTLCVIDHKPRKLDEDQIAALGILSDQVMNLLELRRKTIELEKANNELIQNNQELEKFAYLAAHDLKSPLNNILALTEILEESNLSQISDSNKEVIEMIKLSSETLSRLITGILDHSRPVRTAERQIEAVDLGMLVKKMEGLFSKLGNFKLKLISKLDKIDTDYWALKRILINLVANAINYGDKETTEIELRVEANELDYIIAVSDNGPGIDERYHDTIFDLFRTLSNVDRFGRQSTGIGLATVKKTVEELGGNISVHSKNGKGTTFRFTLRRGTGRPIK